MSIRIELASGRAAMDSFARLPFEIYRGRDAWWPPDVNNEIALISGKGPLNAHLELAPFGAWRDEHLVARVSSVVNYRYNQHWSEKLGQLIHFEALPDESGAVQGLLEHACQWLKERGMTACRSGFAAFLDYPYAIDNYGELPSFLLRGNPPYYHSYFKNAGFVTEKGQVDYTAALDAENLRRYEHLIERAAAHGATVKSWRQLGFARAVDSWTDVTNAAFARHWGWNPISREEVRVMMASLVNTPVIDLSMVGLIDDEPVGTVFSVPDLTYPLAQVRPGVKIPLNRGGGTRGALINIGVVERARGLGLATAMAARSFQTMAQMGMRYAGYTLVHDDNWPSRRTAESLGGRVTANFVTYRRDF
jgi:ribosomal protein S18 acetylase RimI-like enzyme